MCLFKFFFQGDEKMAGWMVGEKWGGLLSMLFDFNGSMAQLGRQNLLAFDKQQELQ